MLTPATLIDQRMSWSTHCVLVGGEREAHVTGRLGEVMEAAGQSVLGRRRSLRQVAQREERPGGGSGPSGVSFLSISWQNSSHPKTRFQHGPSGSVY